MRAAVRALPQLRPGHSLQFVSLPAGMDPDDLLKSNGREAGAVFMPAPQSGSPMTYMVDGKQYIVVAVSGGSYSGEFLAFTLPGTSGT